MQSPKHFHLLPLSSKLNKQNSIKAFSKQEQQVSSRYPLSTFNGFKTIAITQPATQYDRTTSDCMKILDVEIFSHAETLKLNQTISCFYSQLKLLEQYQENEHNFMNDALNKANDNVEKTAKQCCDKIQNLLQQAKQFHNQINEYHNISHSCENRSKNTEALLKYSLENQAFDQINNKKILPLFTDIKQNLLENPYNKNSKIFLPLSQKLQQTICVQFAEQQRQSRQQMIRLVDYSNNSLENLQNALQELNRLADQKLQILEDRAQVLNYDLQSIVDSCIESRKKEDKLIEQLIQKMIYKMTYL